MDRRTRILAGVFGIGILYALVSAVVYPKWIEPQLKLDQTIAKMRQAYDELRAQSDPAIPSLGSRPSLSHLKGTWW